MQKPIARHVSTRPDGVIGQQIKVDLGWRYEIWVNNWPIEEKITMIGSFPQRDLAERIALGIVSNKQVRDVMIYEQPDIEHTDSLPMGWLREVAALGPLPVWVIRENTQDYPNHLCARLFLWLNNITSPTRHVILRDNHEQFRLLMRPQGFDPVPLPSADPFVVGVYF